MTIRALLRLPLVLYLVLDQAHAFNPSPAALQRARSKNGLRIRAPYHDASVVPSSSTSADFESVSSKIAEPQRHHHVPLRRRRFMERRDVFKTVSITTLGLALALDMPARRRPGVASAVEPSATFSSIVEEVSSPPSPATSVEPLLQDEDATLVDVSGTTTLLSAKESAEGEKKKGSRWSDFISGLAGGAASRASKELLLHPIDTIKTRLQYSKGDVAPLDLFDNLYDGVWPALIVGTPAGAAFFATKDVLKGFAKANFGSNYRELTTIGAVFLANLPYWAIRNPAEIIKTQQQTRMVNGTIDAVRTAVSEAGVAGLYRGYSSNVAYAFPTDAIKFVVYEFLQKQARRKLNPLESAVCGSAASSVAQLLSTPLDVVRTRIMTQEKKQGIKNTQTGIIDCARTIVQEEGVPKLFSGLVPRLSRAFLSGAIQFFSYEATKNLFKG